MTPSTGIAVVDWALAILAAHGYVFTLGATVLENLPVVGSFIPGETLVLAAGFVSSTGVLNPFAVFSVAVVGSLVGSNISYVIGLRGGRPMIERHGHRFFIKPEALMDAEGYFLRHGPKTVFIARFAPGIKNLSPVIAGISRMNVLVFEAYSVLGAAAYSLAMVLLGFFFGSNFPLLLKIVKGAGWAGGVIAALVIGLALWERRRYMQRREEADRIAREAAASDGARDELGA